MDFVYVLKIMCVIHRASFSLTLFHSSEIVLRSKITINNNDNIYLTENGQSSGGSGYDSCT